MRYRRMTFEESMDPNINRIAADLDPNKAEIQALRRSMTRADEDVFAKTLTDRQALDNAVVYPADVLKAIGRSEDLQPLVDKARAGRKPQGVAYRALTDFCYGKVGRIAQGSLFEVAGSVTDPTLRECARVVETSEALAVGETKIHMLTRVSRGQS